MHLGVIFPGPVYANLCKLSLQDDHKSVKKVMN